MSYQQKPPPPVPAAAATHTRAPSGELSVSTVGRKSTRQSRHSRTAAPDKCNTGAGAASGTAGGATSFASLKETTSLVVEDMLAESRFFSENPSRLLASFEPSGELIWYRILVHAMCRNVVPSLITYFEFIFLFAEVECGGILGTGEFGIVYAISAIKSVGDGGDDDRPFAPLSTSRDRTPSTASLPSLPPRSPAFPPKTVTVVSTSSIVEGIANMPTLVGDCGNDGAGGGDSTSSSAVEVPRPDLSRRMSASIHTRGTTTSRARSPSPAAVALRHRRDNSDDSNCNSNNRKPPPPPHPQPSHARTTSVVTFGSSSIVGSFGAAGGGGGSTITDGFGGSKVDPFDEIFSDIDPDEDPLYDNLDMTANENRHDSTKSYQQRMELRRRMAAHCIARSGDARYALKKLKTNALVQTDAVLDLACEARFLASIHHPNIIRLRGTVGEPGTPHFAIVLDRLTETLVEKLEEWKEEGQPKSRGLEKIFGGIFCRETRPSPKIWADRLLAAFDIARAMRYLHQKRILYRDLKPENIGFDVHGEVRIFDFGLAKELKPRDLVSKPDSYEATGLTGSRRYMAPECVKCLPYGFSADVYGFSILFWQMLALETPFDNYDAAKHFDQVVVKGKRPPRKSNIIPARWYDFLEDGWSADPRKRPNFASICTLLQDELHALAGSSDSIDNRSVFLTQRSLQSLLTLDRAEK